MRCISFGFFFFSPSAPCSSPSSSSFDSDDFDFDADEDDGDFEVGVCGADVEVEVEVDVEVGRAGAPPPPRIRISPSLGGVGGAPLAPAPTSPPAPAPASSPVPAPTSSPEPRSCVVAAMNDAGVSAGKLSSTREELSAAPPVTCASPASPAPRGAPLVAPAAGSEGGEVEEAINEGGVSLGYLSSTLDEFRAAPPVMCACASPAPRGAALVASGAL
ncbi:hypothetical protein C8R47DRAFT_1159277 [Mycena vitilis]|nr:hypothetical protein C8R47DRAFT_1159277 [Mycena vitilis]